MDHLAVDLANTALRSPDPLQTPTGAALWWASLARHAGLGIAAGKPRFDPALAAALRRLRAAVLEALSGEPLELRFTGTSADAVLFPIAHAAVGLLRGSRSGRVKRCRAGTCGAFFLDETKNGSRRWCSLRCMERARAPRRRTIAK